MVASIKPTLVDTVKYTLPEHVRVQNPTLVKFLQFYYEFLEQEGQPLNYIQNVLEQKDVDSSANQYNEHLINQLLQLIPQNGNTDNAFLIKNLNHFLRSKGSIESFEFIMKFLFDETVALDNQSKYVLNASSNTYTKDILLTVKSTDDFTEAVGTFLLQESSSASALVETATSFYINDTQYWELRLSTLIGDFVPDQPIKALKRTVNRDLIIIDTYYRPSNLIYIESQGYTITFVSVNPLFTNNIVGMKLTQLNTGFSGNLVSLSDQYVNGDNTRTYTWKINNVVNGNLFDLVSDLYLVTDELQGKVITKTDYVNGTVMPVVGGASFTNRGSLYKTSLPFQIHTNGQQHGYGIIDDLNLGSIERVDVVQGGSGYVVGDVISPVETSTHSCDIAVATIDGIGAEVAILMELDTVTIDDGGYGYSVGDEVFLQDNPSILFTVATVDQSSITGLTIVQRGEFRNCPLWFEQVTYTNHAGAGCVISLSYRVKSGVIENAGHLYKTTPTPVTVGISTGFEAADFKVIVSNDAVSTITMVGTGSGYTRANAYIISATGVGASLQCNIGDGKIVSITILDGGHNYTIVDPIIIDGDGTAAVAIVDGLTDGIISDVIVLSTGAGYSKSTVLSASVGTGASLIPTLNDKGGIISVEIVNPGYNYTGNTVVSATGITVPTFTSTFATDNAGSIVEAKIIDGGTGYAGSEVVPTTFTFGSVGDGYGAVLTPVIEDGRIISVNVLNSGSQYTVGTTITVVGAGVGASVQPRIGTNGEIIFVEILSEGYGYQMGTSVLITGNGMDAEVTPVVETGITYAKVINQPLKVWDIIQEDGSNLLAEINTIALGNLYFEQGIPAESHWMIDTLIQEDDSKILNEDYGLLDYDSTEVGYMYDQNLVLAQEDGYRLFDETYNNIIGERGTCEITITDPTGTGAYIIPIIDTVSGLMVDVQIVNAGVNYTNPSYTITPDLGNYSAILDIRAERPIKSLTWIDHGSDYDYARLMVLGSGYGAIIEPVIEKNGALTSFTASGGSGFIETPSVVFQDNSDYGAISSAVIRNGGRYRNLPHLTCSSLTGDGGYLVARSDSIGSIKAIKLQDVSYVEDSSSWIVFPIVLGVDFTNFVLGEEIIIKHKTYHGHLDIELEDGTFDGPGMLMTESDDNLQQADNLITNFYGKVTEIDFPRRLLYVSFDAGQGSGFFNMITESGMNLLEETGYSYVHEHSVNIEVGDSIYGVKSRGEANIAFINRAEAIPIHQGSISINERFLTESGMLNKQHIKLHDSLNVQNFAYAVRTGLSFNVYQDVLKRTVHPAGYRMFGEVELTMDSTNDTPRGLTPRQTLGAYNALIRLLITLYNETPVRQNSWYDSTYQWVRENRFVMNSALLRTSQAYAATLFAENADRLVTEDVNGNEPMYMPAITELAGGESMEAFADFPISDFSGVNDPRYLPFKMDTSMLITLINNQ